MSEVHRSTQQGAPSGAACRVVIAAAETESLLCYIDGSRLRISSLCPDPAAEADRPRVPTRREEHRYRASTRRLPRRWRLPARAPFLGEARTASASVAWTSPDHVTEPSFCPASLTPPCHS